MDYKPHAKTAAALCRAFELVQSVPYNVSARWVFYGLLQEGFYKTKADYKNKFLPAVSKARHASFEGWRPDTLADETRAAFYRGHGYLSPTDWLNSLAEAKCSLSKWITQEFYVELWYEARAMSEQFIYYTKNITLRPMAGQPSIPYKWQAAKDLEHFYSLYQKPIVVLYFGDLDKAGGGIADVAYRDARKWCAHDFTFEHCGLTDSQVREHNVPQNFEKPGEYQWEALTDSAAREIILGATRRYVDFDEFSATTEKEQAVTAWARPHLQKMGQAWA